MPANKEFSFFDIDPHRLDEEWIEHPRNYHQLAMELADARAKHERAKAALEVVVAELDRDIRSDPENFGVTAGSRGVTEKMVENTIVLQKKYKDARERLIDAKHAMDIAQVGVDTMDHKKPALENAVRLVLSDYWSPLRERMTKDGRRPMADRQAKSAFSGTPIQ